MHLDAFCTLGTTKRCSGAIILFAKLSGVSCENLVTIFGFGVQQCSGCFSSLVRLLIIIIIRSTTIQYYYYYVREGGGLGYIYYYDDYNIVIIIHTEIRMMNTANILLIKTLILMEPIIVIKYFTTQHNINTSFVLVVG